jgi:hypothetical protein
MTSEAYPAAVEIVWRFDGAQNGMPTPEVSALMSEWEEQLGQLEGPATGLLGITITGNGRREWVWYVAEAPAFISRAQALLARAGGRYPVEVRVAAETAS